MQVPNHFNILPLHSESSNFSQNIWWFGDHSGEILLYIHKDPNPAVIHTMLTVMVFTQPDTETVYRDW